MSKVTISWDGHGTGSEFLVIAADLREAGYLTGSREELLLKMIASGTVTLLNDDGTIT